MGPIEWVRSLFGEPIDLRSGQVQTTVSAFSLFTGLYRAFVRAKITDAVSFLVDKRVIYVDTQEVTHDLDLVAQAAQQRGVLDRPFREMHLVLTQHRAGIHLLFDLRVSDGASLSTDSGMDFGDYSGLTLTAGTAHPIWADSSNSTGDNPNGTSAFDTYTDKYALSLFFDGFETSNTLAWSATLP